MSLAVVALSAMTCYTAPRSITGHSGDKTVSELIPVVYQYGVGGIVFVLGLVLVTRAGKLDLKTRHGKRWLAILVGGFVLYLCVHMFFQFIAPRI